MNEDYCHGSPTMGSYAQCCSEPDLNDPNEHLYLKLTTSEGLSFQWPFPNRESALMAAAGVLDGLFRNPKRAHLNVTFTIYAGRWA